MFLDNMQGLLMDIQDSEQSQYEYELWFPYTRKAINIIREGSLVAVKNFASTDSDNSHSVLLVTSVMPMHYALGKDRSGYPAFVEEAAQSVSQDWLQDIPTEETTKIICKAIPTNYEIAIPSAIQDGAKQPGIRMESNIPMIGEKARLLNADWTSRVINRDIDKRRSEIIEAGELLKWPEIKVFALWEEIVRMHFGIFAFTGAGKSNLTSTCAAKMLDQSTHLKMIFYDLMSEYTPLLIDKLVEIQDAAIIGLNIEAFPQSVINYMEDSSPTNLERAANDLLNTTLFPKALHPHKLRFLGPLRQLLTEQKVKTYIETRPIGAIIADRREDIVRGTMGTQGPRFAQLVDQLVADTAALPLSRANAQVARTRANGIRGQLTNPSATILANIDQLVRVIDAAEATLTRSERIGDGFKVTIANIVRSLSNEESKSLFLIQSSDQETLRDFTATLGYRMFDDRRRTGRLSPPVSFMFDEADSFIPYSTNEDDVNRSKAIAREIARRGRKYGLGIGIATQRIVNLDTNVLGQPHTYFVSKLPRQTDRQRIGEAFGVGENALKQTFKFKKGEWLLMSFDATGAESMPIPIRVPDANARILAFLDNYKPPAAGQT